MLVALLVSATIAIVLAGVVMGALTGLQRRVIYFPDRSAVPTAAHVAPGGRDIVLHTDDGLDLQAWLLPPAPGVTDRKVGVLYAPGNGGNRAGRVSLLTELTARGLTVLALDYRGYGGNPGSPSEEGLAADARAGLAALRADGFDARHTLYVGESLGTGVVARLAASDPPGGVLLRSPFTSLADAAGALYPWLPTQRFLQDRYPVLDMLAGSTTPVSVVIGEADEIVPPEQSRRVAAAVTLRDELVVPGARHNDRVMFGPVVADAVLRLAPGS